MSLFSFLNDRIRAVAAGMSGREVRAVLRGDPPTERPNPRFLAHTISFLLHLRPRTYPRASTCFTHTFRLGFLTVFLFVVEIVTGLILMVYYVPTPDGAYESILRLTSRVPFGEMLRDIHRLAGEAMLIFAVLHMLRTYLTGSYKGKRTFTWLTGVGLLIITLGLAFSGYLLPWDQLAYWAVTIGTSMAEATPVIGRELNLLLRGAPEIGADGLLRFYLLHVIFLPLAAILVLGAHYYRVSRTHGISLPASVEEGDLPDDVRQQAKERVNLIPDLLTHEIFLIGLGILTLIVATLFFYDAPLEHHANPKQTPLDTEAPWFFLWVQGLLKLGDKTLMGVIVPVLVLALLFAVPYLDFNPNRRLRKRPLALLLSLAAIMALAVLSYMGTHHYGIELPAATRIVQDLVPEEGEGPLQAIPFEQLAVGIYTIDETDAGDLPPALGAVFAEYERQVNQAEAAGQFSESQGVMIVEDWQAGLKRITLRLTWTDPESEARKMHERIVHLHRDR
jgi:quinol-cytochrome oxidoreductase complex cytochrome b subunit